jgi:hydrogenase maturation protease
MKLLKTNFKFPQDKRILVYGFGNPGRQDDGLGYGFVKEIEAKKIPNLDIDFNYQLNIEDASNISEYDIVVFVDASLRVEEDFSFAPLIPAEETRHTTHAISAQAVLHLCKQIYDKTPESYLIEIKGHEWELDENLTPKSQAALTKALQFFETLFT